MLVRAITLSVILLPVSLFAAETPNVVMIISDDQAFSDYGFMGHETIKTPALDRLADESATFTRGYVPSSLCRPSLVTLVTGLYPYQHKISGNDPSGKRGPKAAYAKLREKLISHIDNVPTLPKMLAKKGYVSHQSGKWWEGNWSRGGFTAGMTRGFPQRGGRHGDDGLKIGRDGLKPIFDFIDSAGNKPFFIWYAPFLPHTPHNPPERLLKKYRAPDRPLPIAKYYAMCEWFDETCGELLKHLDDKGIADNTLVVYVTDNGWINRTDRSAYAPRSKRSPNEGGIRTPIMLRWPGKIKPTRDEKTLVSSIDLAPTILAAAGLKSTKQMQGVNLLEHTSGKPLKRDAVYGDIYAHDVADIDKPAASLLYRWCISGDWKTIVPHGEGKAELYNLADDPWEKKDLASDNGKKVKELRSKLDAWWTP